MAETTEDTAVLYPSDQLEDVDLEPKPEEKEPRVITLNIHIPKMPKMFERKPPKTISELKAEKKRSCIVIAVGVVFTLLALTLVLAGPQIVNGLTDVWPQFTDWVTSKKQLEIKFDVKSVALPKRDGIYANPFLKFDKPTKELTLSYSGELLNSSLPVTAYRFNKQGRTLSSQYYSFEFPVGNKTTQQCAVAVLVWTTGERVCKSGRQRKVWAEKFNSYMDTRGKLEITIPEMSMSWQDWEGTKFCGIWVELFEESPSDNVTQYRHTWLCAAYFSKEEQRPILLLKSTAGDEISVKLPPTLTADLRVDIEFNADGSELTVGVFGFLRGGNYLPVYHGPSKAVLVAYTFTKHQFGQFQLESTKHNELQDYMTFGREDVYKSWNVRYFADAKLKKWDNNWALLWQDNYNSGYGDQTFKCDSRMLTLALFDENLQHIGLKTVHPRDIEEDGCEAENRYQMWKPQYKGDIYSAIEMDYKKIYFVVSSESDWTPKKEKLVEIDVTLAME